MIPIVAIGIALTLGSSSAPLRDEVLRTCGFHLSAGAALTIMSDSANQRRPTLAKDICDAARTTRRGWTPFFDAANRHNDLKYGVVGTSPIIGHF